MLVPFVVALVFTAIAVVMPSTVAAAPNTGPHGFSEIFYAFLSQGNNNGSAMAGLTASGPYYAIAGGIAMLVCRFVPLLARAGAGGQPGRAAAPCRSRPGRFAPTRRCSPACSTGVIVIIGALTFLPGLALGPIVEHLIHGRLF